MFIINQERNAMYELQGTVKLCNRKQVVMSNSLGCCMLGTYDTEMDAKAAFNVITEALYNDEKVIVMPLEKSSDNFTGAHVGI